ncbi:Histone-lysine N-methyltransferase, H3 lysine-79 specific, partial [Ophiophagus hannah]
MTHKGNRVLGFLQSSLGSPIFGVQKSSCRFPVFRDPGSFLRVGILICGSRRGNLGPGFNFDPSYLTGLLLLQDGGGRKREAAESMRSPESIQTPPKSLERSPFVPQEATFIRVSELELTRLRCFPGGWGVSNRAQHPGLPRVSCERSHVLHHIWLSVPAAANALLVFLATSPHLPVKRTPLMPQAAGLASRPHRCPGNRLGPASLFLLPGTDFAQPRDTLKASFACLRPPSQLRANCPDRERKRERNKGRKKGRRGKRKRRAGERKRKKREKEKERERKKKEKEKVIDKERKKKKEKGKKEHIEREREREREKAIEKEGKKERERERERERGEEVERESESKEEIPGYLINNHLLPAGFCYLFCRLSHERENEIIRRSQRIHFGKGVKKASRVSCDGRVVKALDLKSNGGSPRRFESCSQRVPFLFCTFSCLPTATGFSSFKGPRRFGKGAKDSNLTTAICTKYWGRLQSPSAAVAESEMSGRKEKPSFLLRRQKGALPPVHLCNRCLEER